MYHKPKSPLQNTCTVGRFVPFAGCCEATGEGVDGRQVTEGDLLQTDGSKLSVRTFYKFHHFLKRINYDQLARSVGWIT